MGVELGRLVQQRRNELGLSRRDLSEQSEVSYPYLSQIETGDRDPSLRTMRKLADVLAMPVEHMAATVGRVTLETLLPAATSGSAPVSYDDAVQLYRSRVLPAVERKLHSVPPLIRLVLLAELTRDAAREAGGDASR